jgi:hypothetical protein
MPRKIIDLSIFLENDVISDPPAFAPRIEYFTHQDSIQQIASFFPGLKKGDTMNKALGHQEPSIAIHDVPLDWCFQPGVKLGVCNFSAILFQTSQEFFCVRHW